MKQVDTNALETSVGSMKWSNGYKTKKFDTKALVALMASSDEVKRVIGPHVKEGYTQGSYKITISK